MKQERFTAEMARLEIELMENKYAKEENYNFLLKNEKEALEFKDYIPENGWFGYKNFIFWQKWKFDNVTFEKFKKELKEYFESLGFSVEFDEMEYYNYEQKEPCYIVKWDLDSIKSKASKAYEFYLKLN